MSIGGAMVGAMGATLLVVDPLSPVAGASLEIPPGALSLDTKIVLQDAPADLPVPTFVNFSGPALDLEPSGLVLNVPATLKIPYLDSDHDGVIDGTSLRAEFLQIRRYSETHGMLGFVSTVVDGAHTVVVGMIDHFSFYRSVHGRFRSNSFITYNFGALPSMRDVNLSDDQVKEAVRSAIREWEAILQPVNIRFVERSPLTFTDLEIFWGSLQVEATITRSSIDSVVADTSWDLIPIPNFQQEIKFSEKLQWTTNSGISLQAYNIQAVALHELGHVLGLDHICISLGCFQPPVMGANRNPAISPLLALLPEDIAALQRLYGITPVSPQVIFSNFGPGMSFDTNPFHGWTINGFLSPSIGQQAIAQQFTPSGNYTFTDARVALSIFQGPNNIAVFLQADARGLPGAVLEQINVTGLTAVPTIIVANSVLRPSLQNGTPYWLTVVAGAPGVIAGWNWNSIGDTSSTTFASTQGGSPAGPWGVGFLSTRSAFQIDGVPR